MQNFRVTEGIEGYWIYHISDDELWPIKSLCGKPTMFSHLNLKKWGTITHLKERYCQKCYDKYLQTVGQGD